MTSSVAPEQPESGIVFSVHNVGSVEAREVDLELAASEAFELHDVTFKQSLARLATGNRLYAL